ncbi:MAG TPA: DUF4031 domain-containing protein [Streptosporangiaceae bacterium]|nr:DUF4031 domain-containing protein [Streptosporangiaceae bacterium]
MTVYVSKLRRHLWIFMGGRTDPPAPLFALSADSEDELHAFAERLGIRRNPDTPVTPAGFIEEPSALHYTVTQGERDRAVTLGAQSISARQAGKLERQRAVMRGERLP